MRKDSVSKIIVWASILLLIFTPFTGAASTEIQTPMQYLEEGPLANPNHQQTQPHYFDVSLLAKKGNKWIETLDADIGDCITFKIDITSLYSEGHTGVFIIIDLPEHAMSYQIGSGSNPHLLYTSNSQLIWSFAHIQYQEHQELTFTVRINQPVDDQISLNVFSFSPDTFENQAEQSISIHVDEKSSQSLPSLRTFFQHLFNSIKYHNAEYLENDEQVHFSVDEQQYLDIPNDPEPTGIIFSTAYLNLSGIETTADVMFGMPEDIDADHNPETGLDGADIRITYYFIPYIEQGEEIDVGLNFRLNVARLGSEHQNDELTVYAKILGNIIKMGYRSPDGNNNMIPVFARLDFNVNFKLLQRERTYTIGLTPSYGSYASENKTLEVFAEYHGYLKDRYLYFELDPVIETEITLEQTKEFGKWRYVIQRISDYVSTITATYRTVDDGDSRETKLVLNDIPSYMNFELYLTPLAGGGGEFHYDSDSMYDIELFIDSFLSGECRYITLQNMPLSIHAEWTPNLIHGEINLTIEGDGTDFILKDDLLSPDIELRFSGLETLDLHATWNLTNPGDITITKTADTTVDFEITIGNWYANFIAEAEAEQLQIQWLINVTGYLKIDTNWEDVSGIEIYIIGPNVGIDTQSEFFKAEDFEIHWTLWPPIEWDLTLLGEIDFYDSSIEIYLNGNWYHLWPWNTKG